MPPVFRFVIDSLLHLNNIIRSYKSDNQIIFEQYPNSQKTPQIDKELNKDPALFPPSINHHDVITDLELLELPSPMLISGSQDGVIKVWQ